jgi:hypothetical protein
VTAELSNHGHHNQQRADEQPISEEENEDDHSPAGSIGDHHDIMSENIESNLRQFKKEFKKGKLIISIIPRFYSRGAY